MKTETLAALNEARRRREAVILVTDMATGESRLVREGEQLPDIFVAEAVNVRFGNGKSGMVETDGRQFFLTVALPPPRLVVIGAVHISQALAPMAKLAGFDLTIIDPRTAFATAERFAGVDLVPRWPEEVLAERPLDAFTALAALTHDPKIDDYPILAALESGCFYVGALGSRKTHARRVERLRAAGALPEATDRIHAPIGLAIGAQSPAEIAVSILAEVIMALRQRVPAGAAL